MRAKELTQLLEFSLAFRGEKHFNVLITGQPGIGKSAIVEQAAAELDYQITISHPVVSDPTDFKGLPFLSDGKALFLPFGELETLINADKPIIWFIDDLGQASPAVQSAIMQILLSRSINGKKISDFVQIVAATNRKQDRANVAGILEPVKSRFATIVNLDYNNDDWLEWGAANGMPGQFLAFVSHYPNCLTSWKPTSDLTNSPSPRTFEFCARMYQNGLPGELRNEVFSGAIGEEWAIKICGFLDFYDRIPTFLQIVSSPETAKVDSNLSVQYATMGMILDRVTKETFGAVIRYMDRLEREISLATMKLIRHRKPELCNTADFIQYATGNPAVMIFD